MIYNYIVHPGESFNIKTPGINSLDEINSLIKTDGEININHSKYPNGFEVTFTQFPDKIIISSNKELIKNNDNTYSIKD